MTTAGRRRSSAFLPIALAIAWSAPAWAELEWELDVYPENQIFPSMLISTATQGAPEDAAEIWGIPHLGDANGRIGAWFADVKKGDKLRVVVEENALMDESAFETKVDEDADEMIVHPKIKYRYDALANVRQQQPLNVSMKVEVNGKSLGEQTVTADVRSLNDCLYAVLDEDGEVMFDANWNYAAYVNENHPWVDEVLREALETGIVDSFDGYQSEDPEQVILQIYAIWNVMQRRGMHYSSITTTGNVSDTVLSQHVRLFDESVNARQANCVDGTVLLAAVLQKIGLDTFLVCHPDHMYLAVNLEQDDLDSLIGIETTMMGADPDDLDGDVLLEDVSDGRREELEEEGLFAAFEAAVIVGTESLDEHAEEFEDPDNVDYQLVNITEARAEGIKPLGFSY